MENDGSCLWSEDIGVPSLFQEICEGTQDWWNEISDPINSYWNPFVEIIRGSLYYWRFENTRCPEKVLFDCMVELREILPEYVGDLIDP